MVNLVKKAMIRNNSTDCMLCGRHMGIKIQFHHIVPKWYCKQNGMPIDNSYSNGILVCQNCHNELHDVAYESKKYEHLIETALSHKR